MSDPWQSPASDAPAVVDPGFEGPGDESTDPMDVPRAVWADLTAHPGGYVASGLGYFAFTMLVVVVIIGMLGLAIAPGIALEDETLLVVGAVVGGLAYAGGILLLVLLVVPAQMASMMRVIDGAQRGEARLGLSSLFSHARADLGKVALFYFVNQFLVTLGALFFYVPGLVAAAVGAFAFPMVALEGASVGDAYRRAWGHFRDHLGWHVGVWALALVAFIVLEITLVGLLVAMPVMCAWQVFAYRAAHGLPVPGGDDSE